MNFSSKYVRKKPLSFQLSQHETLHKWIEFRNHPPKTITEGSAHSDPQHLARRNLRWRPRLRLRHAAGEGWPERAIKIVTYSWPLESRMYLNIWVFARSTVTRKRFYMYRDLWKMDSLWRDSCWPLYDDEKVTENSSLRMGKKTKRTSSVWEHEVGLLPQTAAKTISKSALRMAGSLPHQIM